MVRHHFSHVWSFEVELGSLTAAKFGKKTTAAGQKILFWYREPLCPLILLRYDLPHQNISARHHFSHIWSLLVELGSPRAVKHGLKTTAAARKILVLFRGPPQPLILPRYDLWNQNISARHHSSHIWSLLVELGGLTAHISRKICTFLASHRKVANFFGKANSGSLFRAWQL